MTLLKNIISKNHNYYLRMNVRYYSKAYYKHTNIVANNWENVANFYCNVFNMKIIPPIRDLSGDFLDKGLGYQNTKIKGCHLRLPGYDHLDDKMCPTLEIFEYYLENSEKDKNNNKLIDTPGFGHIAFEVENMKNTIDLVIKNGGKMLSEKSEISSHSVKNHGKLIWAYVRDCEDNIIELHQWEQ